MIVKQMCIFLQKSSGTEMSESSDAEFGFSRRTTPGSLRPTALRFIGTLPLRLFAKDAELRGVLQVRAYIIDI